MLKIVVGLIAMISCTVVANLFMKMGAMAPQSERILFDIIGWKPLVGLFAFGCAALIYIWLLHWLPLNVAQSFAAAQFIAVIIASSVVLSEAIPLTRWMGILLIASGIVVVALTSEVDSSNKPATQEQEVG